MARLLLALAVVAFQVGPAFGAVASPCVLEPLNPVRKGNNAAIFHAVVGNFELLFPNESAGDKPQFIDGFKIRNPKTGATCAGATSVIQKVYRSGDQKRVLAVGYSGSMTYVDYVALDGCKPLLNRVDYTRGVSVGASEAVISSGCECDDAKVRCVCSPAVVLTFDRRCNLRPDAKKSLDRTRQELAVAIDAPAYVFHPEQKDARFLEAWKSKKD